MGELLIVSGEEVAEHLDYRTGIALMREATSRSSASLLLRGTSLSARQPV